MQARSFWCSRSRSNQRRKIRLRCLGLRLRQLGHAACAAAMAACACGTSRSATRAISSPVAGSCTAKRAAPADPRAVDESIAVQQTVVTQPANRMSGGRRKRHSASCKRKTEAAASLLTRLKPCARWKIRVPPYGPRQENIAKFIINHLCSDRGCRWPALAFFAVALCRIHLSPSLRFARVF